MESLRIESGLIFLGYHYFPAYTSPFHMNLDRIIKLDKPDFLGKDTLVAEQAAGITIAWRLCDRRRGVPRLQHAGRSRRPRGRAPALAQRRALVDVDRMIGMACIGAS